jgi:PhnB protein
MSGEPGEIFKTARAGRRMIVGMAVSVCPRLVVVDPDEATEFYVDALGAARQARFALGDGLVVHVELGIGENAFVSLTAEVPEWGLLSPGTLGGSASLVTIEVDDARATTDRMVSCGATVVVPVEDRPYGRCEARLRDPFGHLWIPTHPTGPIDDSAIAASMAGLHAPSSAGAWQQGVRRIVPDLPAMDDRTVAFYQEVFGLEVAMDLDGVRTLVAPSRRELQLTLLGAGAPGPVRPVVSIEVDDLDAVWNRVTAGGFEIVYARTLEAWGVERFFVSDPDGNILNVMRHL